MTNLKINSTSTPYWCVVVPVEAEDIIIAPNVLFACIRYFVPNADKTPPYDIRFIKTYIRYNRGKALKLLGCITSSGMDEGVREVVNYCNDFTGLPVHQAFYEGAMNALLVHNKITLTADTKAVVVKQIT